MSLNKIEKLILSGLGNYLKEELNVEVKKLGLKDGKLDSDELGLNDKTVENNNKTELGSNLQWERIQDKFRLELINSDCTMVDAICGAFYQTHSYKNIDNPKFAESFEQNMRSAEYAIPTKQREKALKILKKIAKEEVSELDSGWNTRIDEIIEMTSKAEDRKLPEKQTMNSGGGPTPEKDTRKPGKSVETSRKQEKPKGNPILKQ